MVTFARFETNQKMYVEAARRLMQICIVYINCRNPKLKNLISASTKLKMALSTLSSKLKLYFKLSKIPSSH